MNLIWLRPSAYQRGEERRNKEARYASLSRDYSCAVRCFSCSPLSLPFAPGSDARMVRACPVLARPLVFLLVLGSTAWVGAKAGATGLSRERKPNVVLILTDDQDVYLGGMVALLLFYAPCGWDGWGEMDPRVAGEVNAGGSETFRCGSEGYAEKPRHL